VNSSGANIRCPYPGLRPFNPDEESLFFGREEQIDDLVGRLRKGRFVAVIGSSGSGKSSLVRAGMLPALYGGFMAGNRAQWRVAVMRPGSEPIASLAQALEVSGLLPALANEGSLRLGLARAILSRGSLGLVELVKQTAAAGSENLLIVVDQFEELFRYAEAAGDEMADQTAAFAKLLLEAAHYPTLPIYVVLTMRSDFLGDCSRFRDLPEAINDGLYLVPRMTREQLRAAIEGPARVAQTQITPRLVTRLLNDLGDDPDDLPVLQHVLMRTWNRWKDCGAGLDSPIDLNDYEATGGMRNALSQHGKDVYAALSSDELREIAMRAFKALTKLGTDNRGVRRPTEFSDLCAIVNADPAKVRTALDAFRSPECSFLTPPTERAVESNTVLDIAHESLMRKWTLLSAWVDEEAQSAQTYMRLASAAAMHAQGKTALWRDPELSIAVDWRTQTNPSRSWAERYAKGFAVAMQFLDASVGARARGRLLRSAGMLSFATLLLGLLSLVFFAHYQNTVYETALNANGAIRLDTLALELPPGKVEDALVLSVEAVAHADNAETRSALYELLSRAPRLRRIFHNQRLATFSVDGQYLAMTSSPRSGRSEVTVWDTAANNVVARWPVVEALNKDGSSRDGPIVSECFSGPRLVRASLNGFFRTFDWRNGKMLVPAVRISNRASIRATACFADSSLVAVAADRGLLAVVNAERGQIVWKHSLSDGSFWSTAVSGDGSLIAAGGDHGQLAIVNSQGANLKRCFIGIDGPVSTVRLLRDQTILAGSGGATTIAHRDQNCRELRSVALSGPLRSFVLTRPGRLVEARGDGAVVASDPGRRSGPEFFRQPTADDIQSIENVDHKLNHWLAADTENGIFLYSSGKSFRPLRFIGYAPEPYRGFAFTRNPVTLVAAANRNIIDVWRFTDGTQIGGRYGAQLGGRAVKTAVPATRAFAANPDGRIVYLTDAAGILRSYAVTSRNDAPLAMFQGPKGTGRPDEIALSADGSHLVEHSSNGRFSIMSIPDGSVLSSFSLRGQANGVGYFVEYLSPHGAYIVSAAGDMLNKRFGIYSLQGRRISQLSYRGDAALAGFSEDDEFVLIRDGDHLDLLRTANGKRAQFVSLDKGADEDVVVATAKPGLWIAVTTTVGNGATGIQLYDFETGLKIGEPLPGLQDPQDQLKALRFDESGDWLAGITAAGAVYVWEIGLSTWERRACEAANQEISPYTWSGYAIPFAYADVCRQYDIPQGEPVPAGTKPIALRQ